MKLRKYYEVAPFSPSDYASEEWKLTYTRKDDMTQVLETLANVVRDYMKTHSTVTTSFSVESYHNTMIVYCNRTLTAQEKIALKEDMAKRKEASRLAHIKKIKKEAKRLKLI